MKALIDPTSIVQHISSWILNPQYPQQGSQYYPVYSAYPNSARVCQVEPDSSIFPVADPFFWASCPDNCVQDEWYYDQVSQTINPIVNAPKPA